LGKGDDVAHRLSLFADIGELANACRSVHGTPSRQVMK